MFDLRSFFGLRSDVITGVNCIIRLGLPGSGKTLDQTIRDVIPHLLAGEQVYSTYWINWNGDNLHLFNDFEEVENLRNAVVVFDEIGQILPARQWEQEGIRTQLFFQLHRHRHLDIIGNTQDVSLVAKTVGIVANKWYYCEKANNSFIDWLLSLLNLRFIVVNRSIMSYQSLKKMANGWEMDGVMPVSRRSDRRSKLWYSTKNIIRPDLDDYKIELVHKYCPVCQMRQGSIIPKDDTLKYCHYDAKSDTYTLKQSENCPKHSNIPLLVRRSGMYDTDHEPEFPEKTITFQPMIDSPKGYTKIKFQGKLSQQQSEVKQLLKIAYNTPIKSSTKPKHPQLPI